MTTSIDLETLRSATLDHAAALRIRVRLQPAGGEGDKVFPPTYAEGQSGGRNDTKYATEHRVVRGERKPCVLLDSTASQANRMELALLDRARLGEIQLPLISVDFSDKFPDLGRISTLETPHRAFDAILRDATLDGVAFRASEVGRSLTKSSPDDARAMYQHCPTALVFGAWDSTGPLGGLGHKFQRLLSSEVVGIDFEAGCKVGSRLDPLQISAAVAVDIPKGDSDDWSIDTKGKSKGRPSEVNHSNIAPTRDLEAGGVTFEYAQHVAVFSFPALRRLRFGSWSEEQAQAARTVLAALSLAAMALQQRDGYDFRSRCTLVAEEPTKLELVSPEGSTRDFGLPWDAAAELLNQAVHTAQGLGVEWQAEEILLQPMPKLEQLIEASQEHLRAAGSAD